MLRAVNLFGLTYGQEASLYLGGWAATGDQ